MLTDHNTLQAKQDGKAGLTGRILVVVGEEVSPAHGHYLGLGLKEEVPRRKEPQWTVDQVAAQGGLGFIAHPFLRRSAWKDHSVRGFTGLEIYNAAESLSGHSPAALGLSILLLGSDFSLLHWVRRPDQALRLWDQCLADGRRTVGIGGADAHGLGWMGLRLGPYASLFKLVRNHLWIRGELTEAAVYEALREGRLYVAHDLVADSKGFSFLACADGKVRAVMGGQVSWRPDLKLYAHLPSPGEMFLYWDGRVMARVRGQDGWFEPEQPGVYRLEASRKGKPWIYSNPIRVVE